MPEPRIIVMTCGVSLFDDKGGGSPIHKKTAWGVILCTKPSPPVYPGQFQVGAHPRWDNLINKNYQEKDDGHCLFNLPLACSLHIRSANGKLTRDDLQRGRVALKDPFPAEISSLLVDYFEYDQDTSCGLAKRKHLPGNDQKDILYLLHSDTEKGDHAATFLYHVFQKEPFASLIRVEKPQRLDGINPLEVDRFGSEGIRNLAGRIFALRDQHPHRRLVVDITGGFKGVLAPAEALAHCLPNATVRYLFEDSPKHIVIPPLPLSLDFWGYLEHRAAMRALKKAGPGDNLEALRESLPESLQELYTPTGGSYALHPIGERIIRQIDRMKFENTLPSPYGTARTFAQLIDDPVLAAYFEALVTNRQHHWYGDVLPETVPHDRGHAQRLLELAYQLLMPLKRANPRYYQQILPPWAVLVLLGSLWMHDVGHSGGKITPDWGGQLELDLTPYPSLVRDLHHYLGYLRIKHNQGEQYFPQWVSTGNAKTQIPSVPGGKGIPLNEAVAIAYLFHRKKIDWDGKPDPKGFPGVWHWLIKDHTKPLKDHLQGWEEQHLSAFKRVIALQRLLDAFDVVSERLGSVELRNQRILWLAQEFDREKTLIENLHGQLRSTGILPDNWKHSPWGPLDGQMKAFLEGLDFVALKSLTDQNLQEKKRKTDLCDALELALLEPLEESVKQPNFIFQDYLCHLYRLLFKPNQISHYEKHGAIESTVILPVDFESWRRTWGENHGKATFRVLFSYAPTTRAQDRPTWEKHYAEPLLEGEIYKEFTTSVRKTLEEMNLQFARIDAQVLDHDWAPYTKVID